MDEQLEEKKVELEKFCKCSACYGTGYKDLRCQAMMKPKYSSRPPTQCRMPSKPDSPYCGVHRNYKE